MGSLDVEVLSSLREAVMLENLACRATLYVAAQKIDVRIHEFILELVRNVVNVVMVLLKDVGPNGGRTLTPSRLLLDQNTAVDDIVHIDVKLYMNS